MPSVCFYFQVHQPYRLRRYGVFDVGRRRDYFDTKLDETVLRKVAEKCYRPMNALVERMIEETDGRFRAAYSITGSALEQMERWAPDLIESFQRLVATGAVELLAETYSHSLAFLASRDEFDEQVELHASAIERLFGVRTRVFRNTELIFSNAVARRVHDLGFAGVLAEGADRVLGWRSPHYLYTAKGTPDLRRSAEELPLSDDIAFRFGNRGWASWPLTAEKFAELGPPDQRRRRRRQSVHGLRDLRRAPVGRDGDLRVHASPAEGRARPRRQGVRDAVRADRALPAGAHELDVPHMMSWADTERDLSAWLGNAMQSTALTRSTRSRDDVRASGDAQALEDFRRLTTSDHFYYMCTKYFADGDVHKYFSPYE